jgi:hypothetical protein
MSFDVVSRAWPRILSRFKKSSPSGAPFLEKGEVVSLEGHTIILAFADCFAKDRIQESARGKAMVERDINLELGTEGLKVRCITRDPGGPPLGARSATAEPPARASGLDGLLDAPEPDRAPGTGEPPATPPPGDPAGHVAGAAPNGAEAVVAVPVGPTADAETSGESPETSLLAEALSVFGGSVVRTEPRAGG